MAAEIPDFFQKKEHVTSYFNIYQLILLFY